MTTMKFIFSSTLHSAKERLHYKYSTTVQLKKPLRGAEPIMILLLSVEHEINQIVKAFVVVKKTTDSISADFMWVWIFQPRNESGIMFFHLWKWNSSTGSTFNSSVNLRVNYYIFYLFILLSVLILLRNHKIIQTVKTIEKNSVRHSWEHSNFLRLADAIFHTAN